MIDTACKSLDERLEAKRADGLVDIKFFVNPFVGATPTEAYGEAEDLIAAVEDPTRVKDFVFNDDHRVAA